MIQITEEYLKELGACEAGIQWFIRHDITSIKRLVTALLKDNHADYARWLLSRLLTHTQRIQWSIDCAKLSLPAFEKVYPNDSRPREAIQAAQDFLRGKIDESAARSAELAARSAARSVWSAWSAARSAARSAESAWSAWSAARSAELAARSAARSAESAWSAARSAARSAESARNKKIMNYALSLLGE